LAIGWKQNQIRNSIGVNGIPILLTQESPEYFARNFDYRDWRVIGPIAEKYGCFPTKLITAPGWCAKVRSGRAKFAYTPQKAIALAVIGV
jgi:hypothetical protein